MASSFVVPFISYRKSCMHTGYEGKKELSGVGEQRNKKGGGEKGESGEMERCGQHVLPTCVTM